jgi:hypothetical protein
MIRLLLANLLLRWREHRDRDRIADLQAQIERARLAAGDQTHEARDRYTRRKRELEAQVRQHGDRLARLARQEEREARERIGRLAPAAPGRSRAPVSQPTPPRVSQEDGGRLFERVGRRRISGEG